MVVEDLILYLKLWYYTPDTLKPRLVFLTGRQAAGYGASPFVEFHKLGVPIVPYREFAQPGTEFVFYAEPYSKLRSRIVDSGGTIETLGRFRRRVLLRAHIN